MRRHTVPCLPGLVYGLIGLLFLSLVSIVKAQTPEATKGPGHHLLYLQYAPGNKLIEMTAEGEVVWEHTVPSLVVMFERLKNGNIVYAYGGKPTGVQEISPDHKVLWNYEAKCEQVLGFSRLPNGNILLGEQGPCQAVEVNRKGEEVHVTPLTTSEKGAHRQLRSIHKLKNGNILACHEGDGVIREYKPDGTIVWEYPGVDSVFEAVRLNNGNTLIGGGKTAKVMEVTPDKKIVWEFGATDAPELGLSWIVGIQRLKNGNLLVGNFLPGREGSGVHFFEVTRDKKVIWSYRDQKVSHLVTMAHYLDTE